MRFILAGALAAAVVASSGVHAEAAEYKLLRLNGSLVKWGSAKLGTPGVVTYALADRTLTSRKAINCKAIRPVDGMLARSGVEKNVFLEELESAFATWERAAPITFKRVSDPATADIVIGAQVKPRGRAFTNVDIDDRKSPRRITSIKKSLICFNPTRKWKVGFDGDVDTYDVRYTLIHEIGHAIGLDHPSREGEIMGFRYTEAYRTPQIGDISGIEALYGPEKTIAAEADPKTTGDTGRGETYLSIGSPAAQAR